MIFVEFEKPKGYLGAAKATDKAPYSGIDIRELLPREKDSNFTTQKSSEEKSKSPKGV